MSVETIARRYGTALADVVLKTGETETVRSELKSWEEMMASSADLQTALANPSIAHLDKEKVLESLIAKTNPSKTTANFLRVLQRNSRLTELAEINDRFAAVLEERSGQVAATVTSARELSADQKEHLQKVVQMLVEPYRQSDRDEAIACLKAQGGLDACSLAFFKNGVEGGKQVPGDIGNDGVWDIWRLEGPSFVWHFRGSPHVHVWVNIADSADVKLNA